jgi:hypothetical protein
VSVSRWTPTPAVQAALMVLAHGDAKVMVRTRRVRSMVRGQVELRWVSHQAARKLEALGLAVYISRSPYGRRLALTDLGQRWVEELELR